MIHVEQENAVPLEYETLPAPSGKNIRWTICALLFVATTINYVDRQVIALLKPTLKDQFHWTENDYANIVIAFQAAYALGLIVVGGVIDRIGVKKGLLFAVLLWSAAAAAHGLVAHIPPDARMSLGTLFGLRSSELVLTIGGLSVLAFSAARVGLGLAEAANFPASIKAVGEWFPKKERALATGLFNSGANIGAMTAPFLVPWIAVHWGWAVSFYITGALGLIWTLLWIAFYQSPENHPKLSEVERDYIHSDLEQPAPKQKLPWSVFLGRRQTWGFVLAKLLTDPIWWFYLFWVPSFLNERHGINFTQFGVPLLVIYTLSSVGSIGGGWLSSEMIRRGWSVNASRKIAMLICALCVVPIFLATMVSGLWSAVLLVALAAAAHQGFSANLFTIVSDTVPKQGVSSVVGIGGMAGSIGGMFFAKLVGMILDATNKNYLVPFVMASAAYLVALLLLHIFLPRLEPMELHTGPLQRPAETT